jgi:hypothetical protein
MENTRHQKSRDPEADTGFLDSPTEEQNDYKQLPILEWNETVTRRGLNLSSEVPPTLPTGQIIDSKNTLRSFHTRTNAIAPGATSERSSVATKAINRLDPAVLPSGELIDSKNTLRSFHTPATGSSNNNSAAANTSSNPPTLPSGEVINSKNTLRSFNSRSPAKRALPRMNVAPNRNTNSDNPTEDSTSLRLPQSQTPNIDAPAENIYIAELVTDSPRRKTILLSALGVLAIVTAIVVAGVCFSGNCGSRDTSEIMTQTMRPMFAPTVSPTSAPTGIDVVVEGVVSAFVNNISYFGQEIFTNGTNAESAALKWIIEKDPLFASDKSALLTLNSQSDDEVSFRVRQRFPLVILWFQQMDEEGVFIKTWNNIVGWLEKSECEWFGIDCVNGSVTDISFYNSATKVTNNFVGSIPPDIGLLTSLQIFSMFENDVTGTIPESIG